MRFSFKQSILVTLMVLWGLPASAMQDLQQLYQHAIQHNLEYQSQLKRYEAGKLDADIAASLIRPRVGFQFAWLHNDYDSDQGQLAYDGDATVDFSSCGNDVSCLTDLVSNVRYIEADNRYESREARIDLKQPLYDAQRFAEKKRLQVQLQKYQANLSAFQQHFLMQFVDAYLRVLEAQAEHRFAEQQLSTLQGQSQRLSKLYDLGVGGKEAVLQADVALQNQRALLVQTQARLQLALQHFGFLSSRSVQRVGDLAEDLPIIMPLPANLPAWQALAEVNSQALKRYAADKRMADYNYHKARGAMRPQVNLAASYRDSELDGGQGFFPAASSTIVGVEVSMPLYQGGGLNAARKQAAIRAMAAEDVLKQQAQHLALKVQAAYVQLETDVAAYKHLQSTLRVSTQALELMQKSYEKGTAEAQQVQRAEERHAQVLKQLALARYQYVRHSFELRQLAGVLNGADIQLLNQWLQDP